MGEGGVGRGFGGDFGAGIGPGGVLPASNGLGDQLQGNGAGGWAATNKIPAAAGQLWLWDQANGTWKLSTAPTVDGQVPVWNSGTVDWVPTTLPKSYITLAWGGESIGAVAAPNFLYLRAYCINVAAPLAQESAIRVDKAGVLRQITFQNGAATAADPVVYTLFSGATVAAMAATAFTQLYASNQTEPVVLAVNAALAAGTILGIGVNGTTANRTVQVSVHALVEIT